MTRDRAYTKQRVQIIPAIRVNGWSCYNGYIFSKRDLARVIFDDNTMMDVPYAHLEPENDEHGKRKDASTLPQE